MSREANTKVASGTAALRRWEAHPLLGAPRAFPDRSWGPETIRAEGWVRFSSRLKVDHEVSDVLAALDGAARILDVGSGTGTIARSIALRFGGCVVLEPSRPSVTILADDAPPGMRVIEGRAEALPFVDGAFDAVVATWLLQYTPDPAAVVGEMTRVCRPAPSSRVVLIQAAPWNDLVSLYNVAARARDRPLAHHGFLLALAARELELAGFAEIDLRPTPVAFELSAPGEKERLRESIDLVWGLHEPGDPPLDVARSLGEAVAELFGRKGRCWADDGVLLTARRAG
jgi:SAM-dependent methyltransferase